jgi:hypothetical protein
MKALQGSQHAIVRLQSRDWQLGTTRGVPAGNYGQHLDGRADRHG